MFMGNKLIISFLVVALIVSNIFWFFAKVGDAVVTEKYEQIEYDQLAKEKEQALGMLLGATKGKSREDIAKLAQPYLIGEPFEKSGCYWAGRFGFKFNESGELININPSLGIGNDSVCN